MNDDIAISVANVSKTFRLPHEKTASIKSAFVNFYRNKRTFEDQQVFKDISFEIKKGEFFGIVGRNGSGKSTLLKLLAGIYSPTKGSIDIHGKLTPFIELGVGFNPELTGRENVFLNGALLGFNRKEVAEMYGEIVDFAELEKFMDQKLKNYSSGMQVRLAFSVAIRANTDILLIDEVLAVGDQSFQEKCFEYFANIKRSGKTVVFVTHDMSNVERFCDRVFVIDKEKQLNGLYTIPEAVRIYNQLNHEKVGIDNVNSFKRQARDEIHIKHVELLDDNNKPAVSFESGEPLTVKIQFGGKQPLAKTPLVVGLAFHDKEGSNLAGPNSIKQKITSANRDVTYRIKALPFNMGEYYLTVALFDDKIAKQYDLIDKGISFFINTNEVYHGKFILDGEWAV
jgi:ABC-2 type transport system ATP-binding protein